MPRGYKIVIFQRAEYQIASKRNGYWKNSKSREKVLLNNQLLERKFDQ